MMKGKNYIKIDMKMDSYQPKTPLLSYPVCIIWFTFFFVIQKQSYKLKEKKKKKRGSSVFYHNFDLPDPNKVENALNEVKFLLK